MPYGRVLNIGERNGRAVGITGYTFRKDWRERIASGRTGPRPGVTPKVDEIYERVVQVRKMEFCGMTVNEVLLSPNTVFAIGSTGDWRLTAVSKNVGEIFRLFGLEEPKSGRIVLV